tara:strand:- start:759 stop:1244 length:486 start_codon:yes stop_codon:yes gene_type:complete
MALRGVSVSGQVASIRTYDTGIARKDLDSAIDALQGNIEDAVELNEIRYHIRHQINLKNVECGISALLNNKDLLHDEKRILESIVAPDDTEVQLRYLRQIPGDTVQMVVVRKEHYDYVVGQLRDITQKLNEISDTLYQLNNDVSIELDEEDIELLRSKGLL